MKRCVRAVAVLVAAGMFAAASSGAATVTPYFNVYTVEPTEIGADETCAGVEGILTGTETTVGQYVETDSGTHFEAAVTFEGRIDYVNGWYELVSQNFRQIVSIDPLEGFNISTGPFHGTATLYDANGNLIAYERFNLVYHLTIVNGETVVEINTTGSVLNCRFV